MKLYSSERRYGGFTKTVGTTRSWVNYDINGKPTTTGGVTSANMVREKTFRGGYSTNPKVPLVFVTGSVTERVWRNPSSYARSIAQVTYLDGDLLYVDAQGRTLRKETGKWTNLVNYYGPHMDTSLSVIVDTNSKNRSSTEALLKLQGMKVNIGAALGESKETITHLAHTVTSLAKAALAAKRGKWSEVAEALGVTPKKLKSGAALSDRWLEYQFGWKPLMSDIHGSIQQLQEGFRKKAQLFSVVRTVTDYLDLSVPGTVYVSGHSRRSTRTKIYATIADNDVSRLSSLGLINPLQVAWELTPWSFVVDWILPVGNFLEALGATRGLKFVGGVYSVRVEAEIVTAHQPTPLSGTAIQGEYLVKTKVTGLTRQAMLGFPGPALYYKSPFSTTHLTDAVALVRQLISKK